LYNTLGASLEAIFFTASATRLGMVLDHIVQEVGRGELLALQPPLNIRHRDEDRVYPSGLDIGTQSVEIEVSLDLRRIRFFSSFSLVAPGRVLPQEELRCFGGSS